MCLVDINLSDFENEETSSCMEEYQIDITRIMRVEDNRTAVMIHNIPKRYVKFN